jgi:hypothetical protein
MNTLESVKSGAIHSPVYSELLPIRMHPVGIGKSSASEVP